MPKPLKRLSAGQTPLFVQCSRAPFLSQTFLLHLMQFNMAVELSCLLIPLVQVKCQVSSWRL